MTSAKTSYSLDIEDISKTAATLACELIVGIVDIPTIVGWADDLILKYDQLPTLVYDISLASSTTDSEVLTLLNSLHGEFNNRPYADSAVRKLAAQLYEQLLAKELSCDEVAKKLYRLTNHSDLGCSQELADDCDNFDDTFFLVRCGVLGREMAENQFKEFLESLGD